MVYKEKEMQQLTKQWRNYLEISEVQLEHMKIYDCQKYTFEEFKNFKTNGEGRVGWCGGIIFAMFQSHDTEFMQRELIENHILHIISIDYADMENYKDIIVNKHANQTICVDQSSNPVLVELAKYLKDRKI